MLKCSGVGEGGTAVAVVVGVAIIDGTRDKPRALVAERRSPPALAGLWEFPGGKVEAGETDTDALHRECREELAVEVVLGDRLGEDVALPSGAVLRVWVATLTAGGEPRPMEHAELRWATAEELDALPWIPADRPLVSALKAVIAG